MSQICFQNCTLTLGIIVDSFAPEMEYKYQSLGLRREQKSTNLGTIELTCNIFCHDYDIIFCNV